MMIWYNDGVKWNERVNNSYSNNNDDHGDK